MSDKAEAKWGSEHLAAMGRMGLAELRAAFYTDSNVARHGEPGIYGTTTHGEVANSRREDAREAGEKNAEKEEGKESVLDDTMRQAEARDDHGRDSKSLEKE